MTTRLVKLGFGLGAALVIGAVAPEAAYAQPARDPAAAEALFVEGKALMDAGDTAAACAKFAASQQLDPGVGILLYLGDCQEKAGLLASAWATFREAETAAHQRGQTERERRAGDRARALEPALPRLQVNVPDASRVEGLTIRRGEIQLGPALWGSKIPLDPGTFHVTASAPGRVSWSADVSTKRGELTELTIPTLSLAASAAAPPAAPGPAPRAEASDRPPAEGPSHATAFAVGGVGVGLVAFGAVAGILAASAWSEAEDHCSTGAAPLRCDAIGVDAATSTDVWGTTSTVAFALGGAALGAGIWLYATTPDADVASGFALRASASPTTAGLTATGRY